MSSNPTRVECAEIQEAVRSAIVYKCEPSQTEHLLLMKKIMIFLLSERAFYQLKSDTAHV